MFQFLGEHHIHNSRNLGAHPTLKVVFLVPRCVLRHLRIMISRSLYTHVESIIYSGRCPHDKHSIHHKDSTRSLMIVRGLVQHPTGPPPRQRHREEPQQQQHAQPTNKTKIKFERHHKVPWTFVKHFNLSRRNSLYIHVQIHIYI